MRDRNRNLLENYSLFLRNRVRLSRRERGIAFLVPSFFSSKEERELSFSRNCSSPC